MCYAYVFKMYSGLFFLYYFSYNTDCFSCKNGTILSVQDVSVNCNIEVNHMEYSLEFCRVYNCTRRFHHRDIQMRVNQLNDS